MNLLVSKADIASLLQISVSPYNDAIINEQIRNAQESDLRLLIGDELYYAMLDNTTDQRFLDLLEEKRFEDSQNKVYYSFGIKAVIIYYAMARYFYYGQAVNTPFGTKIKENDFSASLSFKEKKDQYNEKQNLAFEKWKSVERYIYCNKDIYPEFCYQKNKPRTFSKINLIR